MKRSKLISIIENTEKPVNEILGFSSADKAKKAGKKAQKDYVKQQGAVAGKQATIQTLSKNFADSIVKSYNKFLKDLERTGITGDDLLQAPSDIQEYLAIIKKLSDVSQPK